MSARFFTSDHHFYHHNVTCAPDSKNYCNRPWDSIESMTEGLVERWNEVVSPGDTVYHLGDFSLNFKAVEEVLPRLNGEIHLRPGNHDKCFKMNKPQCVQKYLDNGFKSVKMYEEIEIDGMKVGMCHLPYAPEDHNEDVRFLHRRPKDKGLVLLHGHRHSTPETRIRKRQIDVGVDAWYYYPVSEEELIPLIRSFYG